MLDKLVKTKKTKTIIKRTTTAKARSSDFLDNLESKYSNFDFEDDTVLVDEMGTRLDDLEKTIGDLVTQEGWLILASFQFLVGLLEASEN